MSLRDNKKPSLIAWFLFFKTFHTTPHSREQKGRYHMVQFNQADNDKSHKLSMGFCWASIHPGKGFCRVFIVLREWNQVWFR